MAKLTEFGRNNSTLLALLALTIAPVALYAHTLWGFFLADDFANVVIGSSYPWSRWPGLFIRDDSAEIWGFPVKLLRPFAALSGNLQAQLFAANPTGYRVVSLGLHVINAWLVFAIARRILTGNATVAFTAALLFAVHPVHAETLTWIPGQSDLLPTAMLLGAVLAFLRFRSTGAWPSALLCVALTATAVFTKENTVVLPVVLGACELIIIYRRRHTPNSGGEATRFQMLMLYCCLVGVLGVYFGCRYIAFGAGAGTPDRAAAALTLSQTLPVRYLEYLSQLAAPLNLSRWADSIPGLPHPLGNLLVFVGAISLLLIPAAILATKQRSSELLRAIVFFGPVWFVVTTAPFLFTFNYPRHMYIVAVGFSVLLAASLKVFIADRYRILRHGLAAVLAVGWTLGAVKAAEPWVETGKISKNMHRTIRRLSSKPEGSVFILDLPGAIHGAHLFHWSSPFLLREPFCSPPLDSRFIVLEAPTSYSNPGAWARSAAIAPVANADPGVRAYLVEYDGGQGGKSRKLDTLRLRHAAQELSARLARDPNGDLNSHWRQFVDAAR